MSGDRGLRWPQHARAQLAAALLVALLSALALIAVPLRLGAVAGRAGAPAAASRGAATADDRGRASAGGPRARRLPRSVLPSPPITSIPAPAAPTRSTVARALPRASPPGA